MGEVIKLGERAGKLSTSYRQSAELFEEGDPRRREHKIRALRALIVSRTCEGEPTGQLRKLLAEANENTGACTQIGFVEGSARVDNRYYRYAEIAYDFGDRRAEANFYLKCLHSRIARFNAVGKTQEKEQAVKEYEEWSRWEKEL